MLKRNIPVDLTKPAIVINIFVPRQTFTSPSWETANRNLQNKNNVKLFHVNVFFNANVKITYVHFTVRRILKKSSITDTHTTSPRFLWYYKTILYININFKYNFQQMCSNTEVDIL